MDREQLQEKEMVLIEADSIIMKVVEAPKKKPSKKAGVNSAAATQQERSSHHRKASMMNANGNRKTLLQKQKASSRKGSMMPIGGKGIVDEEGGDHTTFNDLRNHVHKHMPVPLTFKGVLKIVAVEKALAMDRDLIITVQEDDGELTARNEVSVKLPMLCAVDGELATNYARSIVGRLRVEMTDGGDTEPKIVVVDAEKDETQTDAGFGEYFDNIGRPRET